MEGMNALERRPSRPARPRSVRLPVRLLVAAVAALALLSGCAGTTGGEQGPVQVSSGEPVAGNVPGLGSAAVGGVTVTGLGLHGPARAITLSGQVTSARADRLVAVVSNYTQPANLPQPLAVPAGAPVVLDAATVQLRPNGPIDDGATVAVTLTFATAGPVQVFATYKA